MNAVLGIKGEVVAGANGDQLMRVGITCALCHSSVDDSVMPGIGRRVDGAPNVDLNPGAIIALSPALTAEQKAVYNVVGAGEVRPALQHRRHERPVVIPPAYGLADSPHATFSGDGDIRYWNNYVAVTQMGGQGDVRRRAHRREPDAAGGHAGPGQAEAGRRCARTSSAWPCPLDADPRAASITGDAKRGKTVFDRRCASCHQGDARTEETLHAPAETGTDATYANRSASKMYRATPLRGLCAAPAVFPRRQRGGPGRGGGSLRPDARARDVGGRQGRPDRVPEVDLI